MEYYKYNKKKKKKFKKFNIVIYNMFMLKCIYLNFSYVE